MNQLILNEKNLPSLENFFSKTDFPHIYKSLLSTYSFIKKQHIDNTVILSDLLQDYKYSGFLNSVKSQKMLLNFYKEKGFNLCNEYEDLLLKRKYPEQNLLNAYTKLIKFSKINNEQFFEKFFQNAKIFIYNKKNINIYIEFISQTNNKDNYFKHFDIFLDNLTKSSIFKKLTLNDLEEISKSIDKKLLSFNLNDNDNLKIDNIYSKLYNKKNNNNEIFQEKEIFSKEIIINLDLLSNQNQLSFSALEVRLNRLYSRLFSFFNLNSDFKNEIGLNDIVYKFIDKNKIFRFDFYNFEKLQENKDLFSNLIKFSISNYLIKSDNDFESVFENINQSNQFFKSYILNYNIKPLLYNEEKKENFKKNKI